ncbi:MAG: hypothetical protein NTW21_42780 [Verrucomicrobia bacterium]|nr:hypothetical protein [Verrucomicrobiota bacterium]
MNPNLRVRSIPILDGKVHVVFDTEWRADLAEAFFAFVEGLGSPGEWNELQFLLPLFLTPHPEARTGYGMDIPAELVLDTDFLHTVKDRANQLLTAYPNGLNLHQLRSMSVGRFRRELCLDDENHGRGEMDPKDLMLLNDPRQWKDSDDQHWPEHVRDKMKKLARRPGGKVLQSLFKEEWRSVKNAIAKVYYCVKKHQTTDALSCVNCKGKCPELIEQAYPRHEGFEVLTRLAVPQGRVLVIDDAAQDTVDALEGTQVGGGSPSKTLRKLYEFDCISLSFEDWRKKSGDPVARWGALLKKRFALLKKKFEKLGAKSAGFLHRYDLVLMDLTLGQGPGEDPAGYQLLPVLRKFFPLLPLVVYSRFRDMAHVEHAYRRGASWYLPKDERQKLPSHHAILLGGRHWRREWEMVSESIDWDLPPGKPDDDATKYLLWKSVEHMPGGTILARPLAGGLSGSRTFHVSREVNGRYDCAAPIVVKIDQHSNMMLERERYRRFIEPYLSNHSGRIAAPVHVGGEGLAAIAYSYAGTSEGRGRTRREIVPLVELLRENLPRHHQDVLPVSRFEPTMTYLLGEIFRRIHSVDPRKESSEVDFPNLVFGEPIPATPELKVGSAVEPYLWRMPAKFSLKWEKRSDDPSSPKVHTVHVHRARGGEKPSMRCLIQDPDGSGLLQCVKVTGPLGEFTASFRPLRAMEVIEVEGDLEEEKATSTDWTGLWTRTGREPYEVFDKPVLKWLGVDKDNGTPPDQLASKILSLIDWLCNPAKPARQALEAGRIGIIHGDTNLRNIIVERERGGAPVPDASDPWMIDFARTCRGRIVTDYTQLEAALCFDLIRPDFFGKVRDPKVWASCDKFFYHFLESPWQNAALFGDNPRLVFVRHLMAMVRHAALNADVKKTEYLASRIWQCLICHKFACRNWAEPASGEPEEDLRFRAQWTLRQAMQMAKMLGWKNPD